MDHFASAPSSSGRLIVSGRPATAERVLVVVWIAASVVLFLIGILTARIVLTVVGAALLAVYSIWSVRRRRRRVYLTIEPDRFSVEDRKGVREYRDEQVVGVSLFQTNRTMGSKNTPVHKRHFHIWVDDVMEPIRMAETIREDRPDPLSGFIDRTAERVETCAESVLVSGGAVEGEGWGVTNDRLAVPSVSGDAWDYVPISSLAAVDVFEEKVSVWRRGEELPFFRVPINTRNAPLLFKLLNDRIATDDGESTGPGLGRLLFERKPGKGNVVVGVVMIVVAVVMCLIALAALLAGEREPVFILGGIAIPVGAVGALIMILGPANWLRCYERGVRRGQAFKQLELLYEEIETFTYGATHMYYNGAYTGTAVNLALVPPLGVGKEKIKYSCQVKVSSDELDALRDHISNVVARKIADQLERTGAAAWTPNVAFTKEGLSYQPQGFIGRKETQFLPYADVAGVNMNQGSFFIFAKGREKPAVALSSNQPNFYPGLTLFSAMFGHEETAETEGAEG